MKKLILALLILLIFLLAACSQGQDSKGVLKDSGRTQDELNSPRSGDTVIPEFYPPEIGPDLSDGGEIYNWSAVSGRQLGPITLALNWYKSVNGEWPTSWDDLVNGYLLYLPVHPITGDPVPLLTVDELNGPVEATAVVADPYPDGWDIYQARIGAGGEYYTSKVYDREMSASSAEMNTMYPGDARMENFILCIRVFAASRISGFLFHTHNTEGAARMPETYEDLTFGLTRNPSTTLGYTVSQDGVGSFKVGVKPEDFQWAFVFNKGEEEFEIRQLDIDPATGATKVPKILKPGDEGFSKEGFEWILTHEDFID